MEPLRIAEVLAKELDRCRFAAPITHVYNPLTYAWQPYRAYLERWGKTHKQVLLLGMNPGPFGMVQTGVPFGDPTFAREFVGVEAPVAQPRVPHPKRPVLGFASPRREVSGTRLWGWAREHFATPERFFARFLVLNYCPLAFLEASGRNFTPDKLPAAEKATLFAACDAALAATVAYYRPQWVIGVGAFAEARARAALEDLASIGRLLHPSPASPLANRGWSQLATDELRRLGIDIP